MRRQGAMILMVALLLSVLAVRPAQAALPAGFSDALVAAVDGPTGLAFTPDGRLLVTTQGGQLRVISGGSLLPAPALDLGAKLCNNSERGLLGVAVDPAFATNHFVYLYYTFDRAGDGACEQNTARSPVNRVARWILPDSNVVSASSETVLIDNIPSPNGNHNAGDLHFGHDGLLYISVGDGGCDYLGDSGCAGGNDASRDDHVLLGKLLRITRDGAIPSTNPFRGTDSARCNVAGRTDPGKKCQETYAHGFRNPFRFAVDQNTDRIWVNDVGQGIWEEIDELQAGADYGWNVREGHCANGSDTDCGPPPSGMTNPLYDYSHSIGCASITGGAFVPRGVWPSSYDGAYLFSDYVCGRIFTLRGTPLARTDFATNLGGSSAVALIFGPFGANAGALLHDLRRRRPGAADQLQRHYQSHAGGGAAGHAHRWRCAARC